MAEQWPADLLWQGRVNQVSLLSTPFRLLFPKAQGVDVELSPRPEDVGRGISKKSTAQDLYKKGGGHSIMLKLEQGARRGFLTAKHPKESDHE